jgi:hypothetical protein
MKKNIISLLMISLVSFACTNTPTSQTTPTTPPSTSTNSSSTPTSTPSVNSSSNPTSSSTPTPTVSTPSTSTTATCSNEEPVVGTEYTDIGKFVCATDAKLNSKWTYNSTTMGISSDVSVQVVEVNGDKYTVQTEVTVNGEKKIDKTVTSSPSGYSQNASTIKYKYVGKESVTVGSGTFDSYKFTGTEVNNGIGISYIAYLAKTRGLVKMTINTEAPVIGTLTSEVTLKAFQP